MGGAGWRATGPPAWRPNYTDVTDGGDGHGRLLTFVDPPSLHRHVITVTSSAEVNHR